MSRTNCIERAGHVLILCIWVEKRLADLCILKDHPDLVRQINFSTDLPEEFVELRSHYWKKNLKQIKEEFLLKFKPKKCWTDNIEGVYYWRNSIGHGHISLYRDYLLHVPDREVERTLKILEPKVKKEPLAVPTTLLIRFSDDEVYKKMLAVLEELDTKYLKCEAQALGLNYEKIR